MPEELGLLNQGGRVTDPLEPGSSEETIGHNISEMVHSGHPQKQAVAAALSNAREHPKADQEDCMSARDNPTVQDVSPSAITPDPLRTGEHFAHHTSQVDPNLHPSGGPMPGPAHSELPTKYEAGSLMRASHDALPASISPDKFASDVSGGMYGMPWGSPNKT